MIFDDVKKDENCAEVLLDIYYLGMRSIINEYFYFFKIENVFR